MSLRDARPLSGRRLRLPPGPPYACAELVAWAGVAFEMPAGDPRLAALHQGEPAPAVPFDNLVGAGRYWEDHEEWMDYHSPDSPLHLDKMVERALYLDRWARWIPPGSRVLDAGGGIGRFAAWLVENGCEVELVDADLRSLWRAVAACVGLPGKLDVHWSTVEALPDLPPVDVAIAAELLCYVADPAVALDRIRGALRPGGTLLLSVEARWGWALSPDVPEGSVEAFLGDGLVHVPGDRWVRTYEEADLRRLLEGWEVVEVLPTHYAFSGPFEAAAGPMGAEAALALEARLRAHPVARNLNRAWTAVARRRG